ncbi:MAG: hypothetical protein CMJ31_05005 [Phycisphaerae bacterium]|nr:hypothetical protein [Phycisphaerae bacterium]
MIARVHSALLQGIDAIGCEIEVDHDTRALTDKPLIVGLPDASVRESLERVRAAILNSGYPWPEGRVLINLAPADIRKEGPVYDLPIALALLMAQGVIPPKAGELGLGLDPRRLIVAGELALDGRVRPVRGAIAMASLALEKGFHGLVCPAQNAAEAAVVEGVDVYPAATLSEIVAVIAGQLDASPIPTPDVDAMLRGIEPAVDFGDVRGQEAVKRAATIAAAGGHNLLMLGPAGSGKTMMAKALPGVLPPLTRDEALEITRIYSAAGALPRGQSLVTQRPVRTPHHTASAPAIVGGGAIPRAGEISLAHRGILFLDELPEFNRGVLETLRQPLEDRIVTIARSHGSVTFPASFMLIAAMNPTPKGDVGAGEAGQREMDRYLARLSGPLLDRIDLHVEAPAVPFEELSGKPKGTNTETMRSAAYAARERAAERQGVGLENARLTGRQLDELAPLDEHCRALVGSAMSSLGLSARAYDKVRRVARTIADLASSTDIRTDHVAEAVSYRLLDRQRV